MSNQLSDKEVLEAVFAKVEKNGYKGNIPKYDDHLGQWYISDQDGGYIVSSIVEILVSHSFNKALWGNQEHDAWMDSEESATFDCINCNGEYVGNFVESCWEYHIQLMVISPNPIHYLREHAL